MLDVITISAAALDRIQGGAPRQSAGTSGIDSATKLRLDMMNDFVATCKAKQADALKLSGQERRDALNDAFSYCSVPPVR
jgi:hypothetical protein